MTSRTDLGLLIENRSSMLSECLVRARTGECSGGLFFDICFHYRLLAIAHLLLEADSARFADHLVRCGQARRHYLERVDRTPEEAGFLCCSNDKGWEALVVAGDLTSARHVAGLQPDAMSPADEYEEDFLFKRALYALADDGTQGADKVTGALAARLDSVDTETSKPKASVLRGLLERSATRYTDGLSSWVRQREARFAELADTPGFSREHAITERHVFVLGLAIERIAQLRGMSDLELPSLPSLARVPLANREMPGDAWLRHEPS